MIFFFLLYKFIKKLIEHVLLKFWNSLKVRKIEWNKFYFIFYNQRKKKIRGKNVFVSLFNVINDINIIYTI